MDRGNQGTASEAKNQMSIDPHGLKRYVQKQRDVFSRALGEIKGGQKTSCWMWYVIPTPPFVVKGVERGSYENQEYALRDPPPHQLEGFRAARAYLRFPTLDGVNLRKNYLDIMEAVAQQLEAGVNPVHLVGPLDNPKLRSSAQLFEFVSRPRLPTPPPVPASACDAGLPPAWMACCWVGIASALAGTAFLRALVVPILHGIVRPRASVSRWALMIGGSALMIGVIGGTCWPVLQSWNSAAPAAAATDNTPAAAAAALEATASAASADGGGGGGPAVWKAEALAERDTGDTDVNAVCRKVLGLLSHPTIDAVPQSCPGASRVSR